MIIVQDSREQNPLPFRQGKIIEKVIVQKLDVGDYTVQGYENQFAFERKSLPDLFSTCGIGHDRFKKCLERSTRLKYFALVIEGTFSQIRYKDFPGAHNSRMRGDVVLKILFDWQRQYGFHLFFCQNRTECINIIKYASAALMKKRTYKIGETSWGIRTVQALRRRLKPR
jgi:ERCC4-type nuclease